MTEQSTFSRGADMGNVFHWVNKFNWTALTGIVAGCLAFVTGMGLIADAIKANAPSTNLTVQIDNKGDVRAFKKVNGELVPIPVPK